MARTSTSSSPSASAELQHETGSLEELQPANAVKFLTHSCTDSVFDDTSTTAKRCTKSAAELESNATAVPADANDDAKSSSSDVQ